MKTVLISIQPKWCELIASGKKTVEVRKTKPKLATPFKCYIYCTKDEPLYRSGEKFWCKTAGEFGNGKVIGEFVCDKVIEFENDCYEPAFVETADLSCIGIEGLCDYLGKKDKGYGWHITDLLIYDDPKRLMEFCIWKKCNSCRDTGYESTACMYDEDCKVPAVITRPPQSWCYVEERSER